MTFDGLPIYNSQHEMFLRRLKDVFNMQKTYLGYAKKSVHIFVSWKKVETKLSSTYY